MAPAVSTPRFAGAASTSPASGRAADAGALSFGPGASQTRAYDDPRPGVRVASDLVERAFTPSAPNELWCADTKHVPSWEGWLYLAAVMDCYSRGIVGWSMRADLAAEVVDALEMAIHRRRPESGTRAPLGPGSQYVSLVFGEPAARSGSSARWAPR